jgi:RimJ/RimL family protein N-acetyltransferase
VRLLPGQDKAVRDFVAGLSPVEQPVWGDGDRAFGIIRDDGALVAGVVFSNWRPAFATVELSGAALSRFAFRPRILASLGDYAFGKLEVFSVWARTSLENKPARAMLKHLGFVEGGVEAHWYGKGRHAARCRLIKPDWERKWGAVEVARKAA